MGAEVPVLVPSSFPRIRPPFIDLHGKLGSRAVFSEALSECSLKAQNPHKRGLRMLGDWRTIRVFVSSTFRDMQAERDVLMKFVFPKIRRLCAERGVTFTEVDLRWGITQEQAERGEVLPICLAEIERCRPYFIGIDGGTKRL
jgi:hypothetical protein